MSPSGKDVTSLPSQTIYLPTNASFLGACIPSIATLVRRLGTGILGESPAANWGFSAVGGRGNLTIRGGLVECGFH